MAQRDALSCAHARAFCMLRLSMQATTGTPFDQEGLSGCGRFPITAIAWAKAAGSEGCMAVSKLGCQCVPALRSEPSCNHSCACLLLLTLLMFPPCACEQVRFGTHWTMNYGWDCGNIEKLHDAATVTPQPANTWRLELGTNEHITDLLLYREGGGGRVSGM